MPLPLCVRIDAEDARSASALKADGWREIEVLETWRRGLKPFIAPRMNFHRRRARPDDLGDCAELASSAFGFDRLHADSDVDDEEADSAKAAWVSEAFGDQNRVVQVAIVDEAVAGFLITQRRTFRGENVIAIDLVAVAEPYRRHGIAHGMISKTLMDYRLALIAGTQQTNKAARSLYRNLDFTVVREQRTFHK